MKNLFLLLFTLSWLATTAQSTYTIDTIPSISIKGNSTLHDWTVQAGSVADYPTTLAIDMVDGGIIDSFSFTVPVANLDGGRGPSMNAKIKTAFEAATNPTISYQQIGPAVIKIEEAVNTITSTGILTMAGMEKEIEVKLKATEEADVFLLKGSKDLKMSEFGMTPPSAMFGQIQTMDDITVHFEFVYRK